MPKINQEEYEKIKLLPDYDWNWIAREKTGKILSFTNKPTKTDEVWKDKQTRLWFSYKDSQLFQFIQWEDEEPYEISELIREYEIKELRLAPSGTVIVDSFDESEETVMKKNIEWAKNRIKNTLKFEALNDREVGFKIAMKEALELINQLDEPEVLSQEWIDENKVARINDLRKMTKDDVVLADKLQNLIVPKQELPVIPKFVAEYLEFAKNEVSLMQVMTLASISGGGITMKEEYDWISPNDETFARAWLDGYEVEEEPLYYALVKGHELITDEGVLTCKYWNLNTSNGDVFPSNRLSEDGKFLIEMSKSEWNKLGINESNADFVKVEELEE